MTPLTETFSGEDAAQIAYDRSGSYEWQGEPITWSERHNWLWLGIARAGNATEEQDALLAMWLGGLETIDDLKLVERKWRRDREVIFDELAEFYAGFFKGDQPTQDAIALFYGRILPDIQASHNEIDDDGDGGEGVPPK